MGNAQKPTSQTRHMDIKYFSLCKWVDRDLARLECIDTSISMANHFTKNLTRALFHRHADYLLGHVPPTYSPIYQSAIGTYTDSFHTLETYVPDSFTTPLCVTTAWVHALLQSDYAGNPWLIVLLHG
jgi:hypothetical protein